MGAKWYPNIGGIPTRCYKRKIEIQRTVFEKSRAIVVPSRWAADSVIEDFSIPTERVWVIPEGANLKSENIPSRQLVLAKRKAERCRLLFLTFPDRWLAKGGDIAFEAMLELNRLGVDTELVVCGCAPPANIAHDKLRAISYLDKNDERQHERLTKLFLESDFMLIPTRCETYGKVFCEANAFGLPAIGTKVGGVPEVIHDGDNGYALPLAARGDEYARLIKEIYCDDDRYYALVKSSRRAFEERLNWDSWGHAMAGVFRKVLPSELVCRVGPEQKKSNG